MDIEMLYDWNQDIQIQPGNTVRVEHLGLLECQLDNLCTYAINPRYLRAAQENHQVSVIFTTPCTAASVPTDKTLVLTNNPLRDFYEFHNYLAQCTEFYRKHRPSQIDSSATIHPTAHIAEQDVSIGADVTIEPRSVINEGTQISRGSLIGNGAVIGAEGYERKYVDGTYLRAIHAGGVRIGQSSFIGSNSVVVRGVFGGFTSLGNNVAIGNLVNVGHHCVVEDGVVLLPSTVLCGSSMIRENARIGPGALINNLVVVGPHATVSMGSVVISDVPPGRRVTGNFAKEHFRFLREMCKRPE